MVRRTAWATTSTCKCARIWGRSLSTLLIAGSRAKAAGPATRISRRWISSRESLGRYRLRERPGGFPAGRPACEERAPEPFNLKYVEIGSENYGGEYFRRFELFRKAIKEAYPEITVISSSPLTKRGRSEWVDSHYYAGENFFLSNSGRFNSDRYSRRSSAVFIGEFGTTERPLAGTLRGGGGRGLFLGRGGGEPGMVRRLAYAPYWQRRVREPAPSVDLFQHPSGGGLSFLSIY